MSDGSYILSFKEPVGM